MPKKNIKWAYSDIVRDHFFNPRNLLENEKDFKADGIGTVGSPACGDVMKMWIKVKDNKITECKWQTFGCASAIASTSMLSEMVTENGGIDIEEALKIKPIDIINRLEGLPSNKIHCSVLGDQALRDAIYDYYYKIGEIEKIPNNPLVCGCMNLRKYDLKKTFKEGAKTFEEIQEKTGVATVCGKCEEANRALIEEFQKDSD